MKNKKVTEAVYEILTGLSGYRSVEHSKWEKQAKQYLKKRFLNKNICLDGNKIVVTNENGTIDIIKIQIS